MEPSPLSLCLYGPATRGRDPWDLRPRGRGLPSDATYLLDGGAHLCFVLDWIGHASIKNTVIYAQLTSRRHDEEAHKMFTSPSVV